VNAKFPKLLMLAAVVPLTTSCGDLVRQGRSPVMLVVKSLEAASGADPGKFSGVLWSDVVTLKTKPDPCSTISPCPTVFADPAMVTLSAQLKDQGSLGVAVEPSPTNQVTITRYHVEYRRADGRNTPGVDVPFPFDSAITFTVVPGGDAEKGFEIVRHAAKEEAPLLALSQSGNLISTIATVTFYGRDQAGNDVSVSGDIGINFGDFGDSN
jgi:hypothetical protein